MRVWNPAFEGYHVSTFSAFASLIEDLPSYGDLSAFTPGLKRDTISAFLTNAFANNIPVPSARKALKQFRDIGLGIRSSDFNHLYNASQSNAARQTRLQTFPPSLTAPPSLLTPSEHDLPSNYLYVFKVQRVDPATGRVVERTESVFSESPLSVNDAKLKLQNFIDSKPNSPKILNTISVGELVNGYQNTAVGGM